MSEIPQGGPPSSIEPKGPNLKPMIDAANVGNQESVDEYRKMYASMIPDALETNNINQEGIVPVDMDSVVSFLKSATANNDLGLDMKDEIINKDRAFFTFVKDEKTQKDVPVIVNLEEDVTNLTPASIQAKAQQLYNTEGVMAREARDSLAVREEQINKQIAAAKLAQEKLEEEKRERQRKEARFLIWGLVERLKSELKHIGVDIKGDTVTLAEEIAMKFQDRIKSGEKLSEEDIIPVLEQVKQKYVGNSPVPVS